MFKNSDFQVSVHSELPKGLVKTQITGNQPLVSNSVGLDSVQDFAFLTGFQVMKLLVWGTPLRTTALGYTLQCYTA